MPGVLKSVQMSAALEGNINPRHRFACERFGEEIPDTPSGHSAACDTFGKRAFWRNLFHWIGVNRDG